MEHATKTDLSLLLECLKCQMKCPDSQKQALLTIYSICQQSGENVEFFQNLGGVMFVHSLSRASPHPQVKQTALFILGALAESYAYCKQALCRKDTFADLVESLQPEVPVTQKRVAVYVLSALVSNNRLGQEFAHTSDCIHVLLNLFRWSFPLSSEAKAVGETQMTQLWTAVSSALCGCVNNPQNDLNQRVCMSAFPLVCSWLQQMSPPCPQLLQPLCSFIAMTLHNNMCAQEYFSSVGGLGTLCVSLADLVPESVKSPPACSMAIMLTKTLAACVTDNPGLAAGLCGLQLVPVLLLLLSCPKLDHRDQLSVVLTMGLCTDSSEEHQTQLLASGGLPLVISLLTDTQDEELKKAATFVLQTCKKISQSGMLGPGLGSCHEEEHQSELENHWKSAKDILQRINNLEKQQAGEEQWERDVGNSADQQEGTFGIPLAPPPQTPSLQRCDPPEELWEGTPLRSVRGHHREGRLRHRNKTHKEPHSQRDCEKLICVYAHSTHEFRIPDPLPNSVPRLRPRPPSDDEMSICSEILEQEIQRVLMTPASFTHSALRCLVSGVCDVSSRSFGALLRSSQQKCETHLLLLRADQRHRKQLKHTHTLSHPSDTHTSSRSTVNITPLKRPPDMPVCLSLYFWLLTCYTLDLCMCASCYISVDIHMGAPCMYVSVCVRVRVCTEGVLVCMYIYMGVFVCVCVCVRQRARRNFSEEELAFLCEGVRRFGPSWNSILWAYPFQPSRNNVDLAQKYSRMKKAEATH
ncbi:telomere repeats-binding bouquet formation protein 1 [Alosa pseudoharengus]|uniref:telomere repeats-binding bouquet formation protein 1 n=1 Tax=Alosa pseudoharengus TaxID=34774 RepID=UPI003F8AD145